MTLICKLLYRAVFKRLSKNQNQSNYSDQSITTGTNSAMNQSQFLAITYNSREAREKSRVHGAIGFSFASHWLKNWTDTFKRITKRSNHNYVITYDSHLKNALWRCIQDLSLPWQHYHKGRKGWKFSHSSFFQHSVHKPSVHSLYHLKTEINSKVSRHQHCRHYNIFAIILIASFSVTNSICQNWLVGSATPREHLITEKGTLLACHNRLFLKSRNNFTRSSGLFLKKCATFYGQAHLPRQFYIMANNLGLQPLYTFNNN